MKLKKSNLPRHMKPKEESDEGRAAWRIAAFFLLMLALTLFARGMAGAAQTTVLTQTPTAATVTETLTLSGTVESQSVEVLTLPDGLTVQSVLVTEGQTVKEGESLLQLDTDTIAQALTTAQGELDKLNLQLAAYQQEQTADDSALTSAQTAYDRAREDASSEASAQATQVSRAKTAVSEAKSALSSAKSELSSLNSQYSALEEAISQEAADLAALESLLAEAEVAPTDDVENGEEGAEPETNEKADEETGEAADDTADLQAQIEALEAQIATDEETLASYDSQIVSAQEAVESAQAVLDAAEEALEDANTAASARSRSSQRNLEDAEDALSDAQDSLAQAQADAETQNQQNQAEASILSVTVAQQEAQVAALAALQESGGVLTAPCAGKIVSLTGAAGSDSGSVEIMLAVTSDSYVLTLTGSELEELPDGAALHVTQGEKEVTVTVAALVKDSDTGELTATAYLTGVWEDGAAEADVTLSSGRYDLVIPIAAYHEDNDGGFVYVVEEVESVLGLRYQIRRESVTLLASNGEVAAVDGVLGSDSQIVVSSSRSIEDGEYVRIDG
ncbi:MAG: biotin/lipoyl-binding protein [Clostridiales bacterium]|nr:biotin/lipoyl-binding protein [Clostridiales bacterium]